MFRNTLYTFLILITMALLIAPRFLLLSLGPDTKRLSDASLLPTTLELMSSVKNDSLPAFFADDHKYPLLGSYLISPAVLTHYIFYKISGTYDTPLDFLKSYALRESNLYKFVEVEMLFLNIIAIIIIIYAARKFTSEEYSKNTALFAILVSAVSSYALFFSVTPRIHSFLFFFTAVTLLASFRLAEKKSGLNYALAFGGAALAFSSGQTGITNFVMPVLAHFVLYTNGKLSWSFTKEKIFNKFLWMFLVIAILLSVVIGYPRVIFTLTNFAQNSATIPNSFLSQKHPNPRVGLGGISRFLYHSYPTSELTSALSSFIAVLFLIRRKNKLTVYEIIVGSHVASFLFLSLIFSRIYSGYFILAVLPSLFFLTASLMAKLTKKPIVMAIFIALLLIQSSMVFLIARITYGGDTISSTRAYMLEKTSINEKILSSINNHILNLPTTPENLTSAPESELSGVDKTIKANGFKGATTRDISWARDKATITNGEFESLQYSWIIFFDEKDIAKTKETLCSKGFMLVKSFISHPEDRREIHHLLSLPFVWDIKELTFVKATGPNIYIFKKGECHPDTFVRTF